MIDSPLGETERIKREVKKYIRNIQRKTAESPSKDRMTQFLNIAIGLGNIYGLNQTLIHEINLPWANEQSSKILLDVQCRIADCYVKLAETYLLYLDTAKKNIDEASKPIEGHAEKPPVGLIS